MKIRKDNIINAVIVGAIMFGCSCTLCNKKYGSQLFTQKTEPVLASIKAESQPNNELTRLTEKEAAHVR